jgi:hypothetical protein
MRKASLGATWVQQPIQGWWTITDAHGRRAYPEQVTLNGKLFRRAKWREEKPGVVDQYREAVEKHSQHLYALADGRWIIDHADDVNPDLGDVTAPARHFVTDHPVGRALGALALVAGVCFVAVRIAAALES